MRADGYYLEIWKETTKYKYKTAWTKSRSINIPVKTNFLADFNNESLSQVSADPDTLPLYYRYQESGPYCYQISEYVYIYTCI